VCSSDLIHENTTIAKEIAGDAVTAVKVEIQKRINKEYYKQLRIQQ
jgi:hypothetical protein